MKLYQCMHHINMMCHEQGRQLLHFWFLNYFPLTRFHIVNRVRAITPKLYGIYSWNFTSACITLIWCVMNKEDNSCVFGFWIISPWFNSILWTMSGPLLLNRMEYIHETLPVHASHWDNVSWTKKTTLAWTRETTLAFFMPPPIRRI